jgi:hypothetical protein
MLLECSMISTRRHTCVHTYTRMPRPALCVSTPVTQPRSAHGSEVRMRCVSKRAFLFLSPVRSHADGDPSLSGHLTHYRPGAKNVACCSLLCPCVCWFPRFMYESRLLHTPLLTCVCHYVTDTPLTCLGTYGHARTYAGTLRVSLTVTHPFVCHAVTHPLRA